MMKMMIEKDRESWSLPCVNPDPCPVCHVWHWKIMMMKMMMMMMTMMIEKDGESWSLPYVPCLTLEDNDDEDDDDDDDDDDNERWRILVPALCAMFDTGG